MAGPIDNVGIAFKLVDGVISIEMPDIRVIGSWEQENGPGVPNTIIKDFGQLAADGTAGTSSSLFAEFAALGKDRLIAALRDTIDAAQLSKAFTGGAVQ
jgi:hypothetical protein